MSFCNLKQKDYLWRIIIKTVVYPACPEFIDGSEIEGFILSVIEGLKEICPYFGLSQIVLKIPDVA